LPTENGSSRNRDGGLSISLLGSDGRLFGGAVGGPLVAASPVQVTTFTVLPYIIMLFYIILLKRTSNEFNFNT